LRVGLLHQAKIATAGRRVGLAWFSPDCRHFSKAKGAKPVENDSGLAWIVIRWALDVGPRVMMLENVEEFKTWGRCWLLKCGRTRNASGKHSRLCRHADHRYSGRSSRAARVLRISEYFADSEDAAGW
jgi:site-specific DNA-cytosine methylase